MRELGEAERALLALARDAHDPTDGDRARVRAALAARLGATAGLGAAAALGTAATAKATTAGAAGVATTAKAAAAGLGSSAASAAVTGGALATKLAVAVALTATVTVGASVGLNRRTARRPAPVAQAERHGRQGAPAVPRSLAVATPGEGARQTSPDPGPLVPPSPPMPDPSPRIAPAARPAAAAPQFTAQTRQAPADKREAAAPGTGHAVTERADPNLPTRPAAPAPASSPEPVAGTQPPAVVARPTPRPAPAAPAGGHTCQTTRADLDTPGAALTVADEARLVHDGVRALHEGQPACALTLLDTHAHFYPRGVLAEEREAERALALAELGRMTEARAVAAAFLRAHPTSPLGARLRQRISGIDSINHDVTGGRQRP